MSINREEYWTELHTIGSTTIMIEMTRFGLLWHGHAAKVTDDKRIERNALAVAWGADQEHVYQEVLTGAHYALERRNTRNMKARQRKNTNGMYVMGCWRSFPGQPKPSHEKDTPPQ